MNPQHPPPDGSPGPSLHCEDCSRTRANDEPGWVQVRYPHGDRGRPAPAVFLYYCPLHAGQFELRGQDVVAVPALG